MDKEIRSHPGSHPFRPDQEAEEEAEEAAIKEATQLGEHLTHRVDLEDLVGLVVEAMTLAQMEMRGLLPVMAEEMIQA